MHAGLALIVHRLHGWIAEHLQAKFIFFHSEIRNHCVLLFYDKAVFLTAHTPFRKAHLLGLRGLTYPPGSLVLPFDFG